MLYQFTSNYINRILRIQTGLTAGVNQAVTGDGPTWVYTSVQNEPSQIFSLLKTLQ